MPFLIGDHAGLGDPFFVSAALKKAEVVRMLLTGNNGLEL
jgi:hypothetical protein